MRLVNWRRVRKAKLLGFASVELAIGLQIHDCPVLNGPHGPLVALPARSDAEG
jgi:DNA-binding cell septation regulator SpoVG